MRKSGTSRIFFKKMYKKKLWQKFNNFQKLVSWYLDIIGEGLMVNYVLIHSFNPGIKSDTR